jgi:hypothetical protein
VVDQRIDLFDKIDVKNYVKKQLKTFKFLLCLNKNVNFIYLN